jgi:threonylcarbamoyladenosine tRNA methylthiotransferase MtaB
VAGGREKTRANLKIQEGCDVHCSYCIIPAARGRPRSREFADTLREVRTLLERGAREIVLTGINTGLYDSGGKRLPELLAALAALPGEFRLRVSSLEPGPILPAVVAVMAAHPARICPHLHLPLQAADDRILRLMRRPYTFAEYAQQVAAAIRRLPGLCLGSDLIAGFPGETAELFAAGLEKLRQLPLAYLHVFSFSPRPGTLAATLPGQIPAGECRERVRTLEAQGERFAQSYVASRLGQTVQVLTESRDGAGRWRGTSEQFLEVTVLDAPADTAANRFLPVRLERALGGRAAGGRYAGG